MWDKDRRERGPIGSSTPTPGSPNAIVSTWADNAPTWGGAPPQDIEKRVREPRWASVLLEGQCNL